jgi:hypothetical protein
VKRTKSLTRRTPLTRTGELKRRAPLARRTPLRSGSFRASPAQQAKVLGARCLVCGQSAGITPAHLAPRSLGGCEHPDCVTALCLAHHGAFDAGQLDLLPFLEPRWRAEIAHAVLHLGLLGAVRRLAGGAPH